MSPPTHGVPTTERAFIDNKVSFIGPCHISKLGGKSQKQPTNSNEPSIMEVLDSFVHY